MAKKFFDRVLETTTTTGTGALTLGGAVTGFQRFGARLSVGDTCDYAIFAVDGSGVPTGDWETGLGTYSATNTLTRTTVQESSNGDAAVSFGAGVKRVILGLGSAAVSTLAAGGGRILASCRIEWSDLTTPVLVKQYNVTSVSRTASGRYTITFSSALASASVGFEANGRFQEENGDDVVLIGVDRRPGCGITTTSACFTIRGSQGGPYDPGVTGAFVSIMIYDPSVAG